MGKAKARDKTSDQDSSSHSDSGSRLRDGFPSNSTTASSLTSPRLGTSRSAGGPDPAARTIATAVSPEALAEIIGLSRTHPKVISHLSDHHSEGLATAVGRLEVMSRIIRRRNISIRMNRLE